MAKVLLLGVALAVLQQWCGINVIFNYAQEIFAAAGYQVSDILFNIVITGAVNLVFTLVALAAIDRYGRRFLLLAGVSGLALIYTVLGAFYRLHLQGKPMLVLVLAAIACYTMSLAPVAWVVIAEIFPNRIRSSAMSIAVTALWTACFVLTYTFPLLERGAGSGRHLLDLWGDLSGGLAVHLFPLAGNKGEIPGRNRDQLANGQVIGVMKMRAG